MKAQVYTIITWLAITLYFIPVLFMLLKKRWHERERCYFSLYWMLSGIINIVIILPVIPVEVRATASIIYNLCDAPLTLFIFYITVPKAGLRKFILIAGAAVVLIELISVFVHGLVIDTLRYSLGAGLLVMLIVIIWSMGLYLGKIEHEAEERSSFLIHTALLFSYGTYIVIYIFEHFIPHSSPRDTFLVYYISSIISLAIGITAYIARPSRAERMDVGQFINL